MFSPKSQHVTLGPYSVQDTLYLVESLLQLSLLSLVCVNVCVCVCCLLYTSPSPRDATLSRMPSSA